MHVSLRNSFKHEKCTKKKQVNITKHEEMTNSDPNKRRKKKKNYSWKLTNSERNDQPDKK